MHSFFFQMGRINKDVDAMWEGMDEEQREAYGKEYVDHLRKMAEDGIPTASFNVYPVIEAMTDALLAIKPKTRYLIGGSSGWVDPFKVGI